MIIAIEGSELRERTMEHYIEYNMKRVCVFGVIKVCRRLLDNAIGVPEVVPICNADNTP